MRFSCSVAKDYVRLLKYGDSLYRCKQLKKAALGRMATIMKRQGANLAYLEQVRQHLSRLPSIDPYTRTIIVCGFPNVGKSSFINKITRADVEVQPYAFTTKSLFVGHTDYKYLRWQVIDTPGILDHPLEERNVIEMQAVTALAHLRACVLYVLDISEQCGHSLDEQVKLFESIKPLFTNKPLITVINKIDVLELNDLPADRRAALARIEADENIPMMQMSTVTEMGVNEVKVEACERLLSYRVDQKMRTKKVDGILNRLHVAVPQERDNVERPPCIPDSVLEKKFKAAEKKSKRKLEKDLEIELGDDYTLDLQKNYATIPEDERYDAIPEFFEGKNIADYIDLDIFEKLEELEREEGLREENGLYNPPDMTLDQTLKEIREMAAQIRTKRFMLRDERRLSSNKNSSAIPRHKMPKIKDRHIDQLKTTMENLGVDMSGTEQANFTKKVIDTKRTLVPLPTKKTPKLDKESSAVVRSTGQPLKRAAARHELGVKNVVVSVPILYRIPSQPFLSFVVSYFDYFWSTWQCYKNWFSLSFISLSICRWSVNWLSWRRETLPERWHERVARVKQIVSSARKCPNICSVENVAPAKRIVVKPTSPIFSSIMISKEILSIFQAVQRSLLM